MERSAPIFPLSLEGCQKGESECKFEIFRVKLIVSSWQKKMGRAIFLLFFLGEWRSEWGFCWREDSKGREGRTKAPSGRYAYPT